MQINASESGQKIIFIVLAILIVIGGGILWYINFPKSSAPVSVVLSGNTTAGDGKNNAGDVSVRDKEADEILDAIAIINSIKLDTAFFKDQRFKQLRETSFEILEITLPENYKYKFRIGASVLAPTPVPTPTPTRRR